MKLMTKEIEKAFEQYKLGSQDGLGMDARVVVKYFGGCAATWLITEAEKEGDDWYLYGYVTLGFPDPAGDGLLWEWGPVMLSELEDLKFPPFGLPVERDICVTPGEQTVADLVRW